jgi:hypothetical protein
LREFWLSMPAVCSIGNDHGNTGTRFAEPSGFFDGAQDGFNNGFVDEKKNYLGADVETESEKRFGFAGTGSRCRYDCRSGGTGPLCRVDDFVGQVRFYPLRRYIYVACSVPSFFRFAADRAVLHPLDL